MQIYDDSNLIWLKHFQLHELSQHGQWHLTHTKGHQVMVNLYQPTCEYPFLLLHLNIRFCSCRDFSTAQHFHWSYSNIPEKHPPTNMPPKKSPLWITWITSPLRRLMSINLKQPPLKIAKSIQYPVSLKRNGTSFPMFSRCQVGPTTNKKRISPAFSPP